ncbi:MAG: hypothetical protein JKY71_04585 [Alphaproteobacteria bacterium]|nr:hypothetical protein [Alphaproteobacteria bacterium]
MADLLQEVDEVMRQERMEKFWQENKFYIIGFIVGTIVLTGLLSAYRTWDYNVKEEQTAAIIAMQDDENYPENLLDNELDFRGGLRGIALMQGAATALGEQNTETALKLYDRAALDTGLPDDIRQSAIIASVSLKMDTEETPDGHVLLKELQVVTQDTDSPWTAHAHVLSAVIQFHQFDNYAVALTHLDDASNAPNLPRSMMERIEALKHLYTLKSQNTSETG